MKFLLIFLNLLVFFVTFAISDKEDVQKTSLNNENGNQFMTAVNGFTGAIGGIFGSFMKMADNIVKETSLRVGNMRSYWSKPNGDP
ncbi:hypothetical protein PVAND_015632 [Polypedilum vanderplanki]|uniref:Uncharacterized protein n=1 Tax=Polypedilum vanderplanki TaxID=319348 RepID=A0A9J6BDQ7_POLVA|nr:hypothetical protein PVAND_015632 [Polypedilum vanderplanki]